MSSPPSNGITVRVMTPCDIPFADSVRALAGWNQTIADWQRFLTCEPEGCFIAERHGVSAGTATCTCYGSELGWIGMLLVHPDHRRQGVGSGLLQHCMAYLRSRGIACMKLDATPLGRPLYEQLGFAPEFSLTRWEAQAPPTISLTSSAEIVTCSESDWESVLALDHRAFGSPRGHMLTVVRQHCCHAAVHRTAQNGGFGYGMLRTGSRAYYLGPVAADCPATGTQLVRHLLSRVPNQAIFWDVLDLNNAATGLAQTLGFKPQRSLLRMFRGHNPGKGDPNLQFAIVDPATG
jgi:GNAT superfamily N-acetyltransferase